MHLIRGLNRWPAISGCVATIGNFDGIHRGHQAILEQLVDASKAKGLPSCVISFMPLPHEFFSGDKAPARLHGFRDRVQGIAGLGVDRLLLLPFDKTQSMQSADDFIKSVLVDTLSVKHLFVGDDFRFGHQRQGDFALLRERGEQMGFSVDQNPTVLEDGERISSTRIREQLSSNNLNAAKLLLGHQYRISGRVIHGEKVGRQLGFATANVALGSHSPPLRGVFAVVANDLTTGLKYAAVANLGERPTVGGRRLLLEVHMLDTAIDCYGHHLAIDFLEFIRAEQKFDGLEALKQAISKDSDTARRILFGNPELTSLSNDIN